MASAKKRFVVGNWKMYIERAEGARALLSAVKRKTQKVQGVEVWVAPPAPFIPVLATAGKNGPLLIGAQTVSAQAEGAHTGEVSARMLKEAGAAFAIVGHSERRALGESDSAVNAVLRSVISAGMRAILCVGESVRDDHGNHFEFLAGQLRSALEGVQGSVGAKLVVAYEPVWAIGKSASEAARPELVRETAIFIRKTLSDSIGRDAALKIPILYGGSVDSTNAAALIERGDVAGFLVGRASTETESFVDIVKACGFPNAKRAHTKPVRRKAVRNVKVKSQKAKEQLKKRKIRSRRSI